MEASGEVVIVVWTDPDTGTQHLLSHEEADDAPLVAYRTQWDEAVSGRTWSNFTLKRKSSRNAGLTSEASLIRNHLVSSCL